MRTGKIFNADIVEVISKMGHTDEIVVADCGLPIPEGVKRIDISLNKNNPRFMEVLKILLEEYICESYVLAKEIKKHNKEIEEEINEILKDCEVEYISHEKFKERTKNAKAIIRTGECTPYANIILKSGVFFGRE
ncbi:D-ribose pyranase [Peptostreptococcaceae bacterium AGR-M142]